MVIVDGTNEDEYVTVADASYEELPATLALTVSDVKAVPVYASVNVNDA